MAGRLAETQPASITEAVWADLLSRLAPISESYLRRLLRSTGIPLVPLAAGVCQDSFEELEQTLLDLGREYAGALAAGDRVRAQACRRPVIVAKDHARWVLRNPKTSAARQAEKEEMILWLLTWLENPGVFADWLRLRKRASPG